MFVDVSTELLRQGKSVRFRAPGHSMHPTIRDGEFITVAPVAPSDVKLGDILFYRANGKVLAHRVVSVQKNNGYSRNQRSTGNSHHVFVLQGDASATSHDRVEPEQVLGKVVELERGHRRIDPYGRRVEMLRAARLLASRLKRRMMRSRQL